jgi:hypothetical protein
MRPASGFPPRGADWILDDPGGYQYPAGRAGKRSEPGRLAIAPATRPVADTRPCRRGAWVAERPDASVSLRQRPPRPSVTLAARSDASQSFLSMEAPHQKRNGGVGRFSLRSRPFFRAVSCSDTSAGSFRLAALPRATSLKRGGEWGASVLPAKRTKRAGRPRLIFDEQTGFPPTKGVTGTFFAFRRARRG